MVEFLLPRSFLTEVEGEVAAEGASLKAVVTEHFSSRAEQKAASRTRRLKRGQGWMEEERREREAAEKAAEKAEQWLMQKRGEAEAAVGEVREVVKRVGREEEGSWLWELCEKTDKAIREEEGRTNEQIEVMQANGSLF